MPLRTLLLSTLEDRGVQRLYETEPSIDTSVYGSKVVNIVRSCAAAIHPVSLLASDVLLDAFPQTAAGEALDNFATPENLTRKPASQSFGVAVVFGDVGDVIPLESSFDAGGIEVLTSTIATIAAQSLAIVSTSCNAGIATVTLSVSSNLAQGATVTITTGDVRIDGERKLTGVSGVTLKFEIDDQNPFNVSGGTVTGNWTQVSVKSSGYGVAQNTSGVTELQGDFEAYLVGGVLSGGADAESDAAYSQRIIDARNLLEGAFNAPQVRLAALLVAGNTRAWVVTPQDGVIGGTEGVAGYKPQPGQVCVYVVRDGESPITPSPAVLDATKQSVIENGKKTCHTIDEDVFVFAPILQPCTFQIDNLVPDTPAMRAAVEAELKAYMQDLVDFEDGFTDKQQIAVISNTRDASNQRITDFDLVSASFPATSGTLLTFGGVTWL